MILKRKAFTAALLSQLCVSAMAAAQENQPPAGSAPAAATAQATNPAPEAAVGTPKRTSEEEIVVTGSRIRRKDLTTPAPLTVISREQVASSGKVSIGDFLQTLPTQGNALNTSVNNGGDGSTRVNLRGLGVNRTLVLVNGRRFVPGGTGADATVDLNSIPTASIERVEVVPDGASAVYGSDAIAGVVNIITRKNMNGTEASAYGGVTPHGDGQVYDFNVTTGTSGDRGNVTLSAGWFDQHAVMAGDRDYSAHQLTHNYGQGIELGGTSCPDFNTCFTGSSAIPEGRFTIPSTAPIPIGGNLAALKAKYPKNSTFIHDPTIAPIIGCTPSAGNDCRWRPYSGLNDPYNFQPENYNQTPNQRLSLYGTGGLKIADVANGYIEASYVNRQSDRRLAPMPLFTIQQDPIVTVSASSIYNPWGVDFTDVRRRLVEFGPRRYVDDISTFRVVTGVNGTLSDDFGPLRGWYWDANVNYGRTQGNTTTYGPLLANKIQDAVGPSMMVGGVPTCVRTPGDASTAIPGCVPLNLFGGANTITPDQVSGLGFVGTSRGINQLTMAQATVSGELFNIPTSDRPVGLALGYEFRHLYGQFIPDPVQAQGLSTDVNLTATSGGYVANEGYGELSIPLLGNMPFVQALELTAAARVFNYNIFGTDWTYNFGARWQVVPDFTVRGTVLSAYRAPAISELYLGASDNFPSGVDPCAATVAGSTLDKNCVAQGVPSGGNGDTDTTQIKTRNGGNPSLKPETANIFTVGIVVTPRMVRNLSITVDYWNYRIYQSLSTYGLGVILNECYPNDPKTTPTRCNLVHRDPASALIVRVDDLNVNVGTDKMDGIDAAVRYALPTEVGRFGFLVDAVWLHKFDRTLDDGSVIHARGTYDINNGGIGGVYPAWKFNAGVRYDTGPLALGLNTKFIGQYKECANLLGINGSDGACYLHEDLGSHTVSAYNTWDAFATYTLRTGFGRTVASIGILNMFNSPPPVVYNAFTPQSDATAYDFVGRFIYGRFSQTF